MSLQAPVEPIETIEKVALLASQLRALLAERSNLKEKQPQAPGNLDGDLGTPREEAVYREAFSSWEGYFFHVEKKLSKCRKEIEGLLMQIADFGDAALPILEESIVRVKHFREYKKQ